LGQYKNARKDISAFHIVIKDVEESIKNYSSFEYELSILATMLRHSAILGCYLIGQPQFNRKAPIKTLVNLWDLDPTIYEAFDELYSFKLMPQCENKKVSLEYVLQWCQRVKSFLGKIEQQVFIYERTMC
jgi:hypothetical protein